MSRLTTSGPKLRPVEPMALRLFAMDFALVGGNMMRDASVQALGPVEWYKRRKERVGIDPKILRMTPILCKWWAGAVTHGNEKVKFDMRGLAPDAWMKQLPEAFAMAKEDYKYTIGYLGHPGNATIPQILDVCSFYLDECNVDVLVVDSMAGTPPAVRGKPTPILYHKLWTIASECARRKKDFGIEPMPRLSSPAGGVQIVFVEDDPVEGKANVDWYLKQDVVDEPRATAARGKTVIVGMQQFLASKVERLLGSGYHVAMNLQNPETRAWFLKHAVPPSPIVEGVPGAKTEPAGPDEKSNDKSEEEKSVG